MSLTSICIWLPIGLVLVAVALEAMDSRRKKTLVERRKNEVLVELEEERRKNEVLKEYAYKLELYIDVMREQRDEALENYDKLSHSWPYSEQMEKTDSE